MAVFGDEEKVIGADQQKTLLVIRGDKAILDGKFKISQSIEIDCELKGKLTVGEKLTIQENGMVKADVKTNEAEIIGKYKGNMRATGHVEIKETGNAFGSIKTDSLIINEGGVFSGNVARISDEDAAEELKKTSKKSKSADKDDESEGETED